MNSLYAILFLVAPILVAGTVAFFVPIKQTILRLILACSAAYLFSISIISLLPEAIANTDAKQVGLFIVIGFCMQLLIDTFSTGIEHGHVHLHSHNCEKHLPIGIIIGLCLHSLLEGLPIANFNQSINHQLILGLGIHNFPITITFVALLKEHQSKKIKTILLLITFAAMAPIGFLIGYLLQHFGIHNYQEFSRFAYALVIGIFLHISTAILFESSEHHKYNIAKIIVMAAGVILAYIIG